MSSQNLLIKGIVAVTINGLLLPGHVIAAQPIMSAAQNRTIRDVALAEGGVMRGQIVNAAGIPQPGVAMRLKRQGQDLALTRTDAQGVFTFQGLDGGTYDLVASEQEQHSLRLWTPGAAPPSATPSILLVRNASLARAQLPAGSVETAAAIGVGVLIAGGIWAIAQSDSGS
jgi:hypothetical protein